jgi:hypothetical protein
MEQLINQVAQRTGISPDKARTAIDTVVGYLKERLPEPIASKLDGAVSGEKSGGGLGDAASELGNVFGKK